MALDAALRVLAMNPAAEALLGMSAKQVRGVTLTRLLPRARAYARVLNRVRESEQPLTERETRLVLPGRRVVIVDCTITPLPELDGGILLELVPVDRYRRITREEQLVVQSESVRALVRGLAHEIRNPLGGLRGAAQLLERELPDEALREYTQIIMREADRLRGLMDRMLGPHTLPQFQSLNVHEITERVAALIGAESGEKVQVVRDYDPSLPDIRADPQLLMQATLNVARNAVQALDGGGVVRLRTRVHRQLTIGSRRHRLVVAIDIIDNGPGVPEGLRESIFFPMVTGRVDGTGLGLSIAQSLVGQHGGLIEFAREAGETIFSLLIPVESAP